MKDLAENYKDELNDCSNLNTLIYAGAFVVAGAKTKPLSKPSTMKKKSHSTPDVDKMDRAVDGQPRKTKFCEKEIVTMRRKIGKLTNLSKTPSKQKTKKLQNILKGKDVKTAIQDLRMRLAAKSKKIRTTKLKKTRFVNNKLFFANQKQFYSQLRGESQKIVTNPPEKKDIENLWNGIWGDDTPHNQEAG